MTQKEYLTNYPDRPIEFATKVYNCLSLSIDQVLEENLTSHFLHTVEVYALIGELQKIRNLLTNSLNTDKHKLESQIEERNNEHTK